MLKRINIDSSSYNQALHIYLSSNSQLSQLINPVYACYYGPGGPGGYGANLRTSKTGYRGFTAEGIEKILELKGLNVSFIKTKDAFQKFVHDTPMSTRRIAVIAHKGVTSLGGDQYIYAIVYEKTKQYDNLYLYDSKAIENDCLDNFKSYFRESFRILCPDEKHRVYDDLFSRHDDIENASVIEDVLILIKEQDKAVDSSQTMSFFSSFASKNHEDCEENTFSLSPAFHYDEQEVRRRHLCDLIRLNEYGLLNKEESSLRLMS